MIIKEINTVIFSKFPINVAHTTFASMCSVLMCSMSSAEYSTEKRNVWYCTAAFHANLFITRRKGKRKRKKLVENGGQIIMTDLLGGSFISLNFCPILISLT